MTEIAVMGTLLLFSFFAGYALRSLVSCNRRTNTRFVIDNDTHFIEAVLRRRITMHNQRPITAVFRRS
jgi:hypothetical protein